MFAVRRHADVQNAKEREQEDRRESHSQHNDGEGRQLLHGDSGEEERTAPKHRQRQQH